MCGLVSRNLAPVIQTFDSAHPVGVQTLAVTISHLSRVVELAPSLQTRATRL